MNMHRLRRWPLAVFTMLSVTAVLGAAEQPYVIERAGGEPITGSAIIADDAGNVTLKLATGQATQRFMRGRYLYAWTPKPAEVTAAENDLKQRNVAGALNKLEAAFNKYKYLGWAGYTAFYRGQVLQQLKKSADAERVYREGLRYEKKDEWEARLKQGLVEVLLAKKDYDDAEKMVKELKTSDPGVACFVFNTRGALLKAKGKKKEALLQYLKTVLVFDRSVGSVRKEAFREAVALLEELKHPRAKEFAARYKAEYP